MSTASRIDDLRRDLGKILLDGLQELRTSNETLRSELLAALTRGLEAHRDELQRALGREQRELALAHKDIRDLRRQLDEARVASGGADTADAGSTPSVAPPAWPPAISGEPTESQKEPHPVEAVSGIAQPEEPPAAPEPDQDPVPSAPPVKETPVPESSPGQDGHPAGEPVDPDPRVAAQVAAEFAAAARELDADTESPSDGAATVLPPQEASTAEPARAKDEALFDTLYKAASISAADIVCHPHTWQFIAGCAASAEHFQLPAATADADQDGLATIRISGRSLVAVLNSLYSAYSKAHRSSDLEGMALTLGYYTQIAHEVRKTRPVFSQHDGPEPDPVNRPRTRVVLDQRPDYIVDHGRPERSDG